MEILKAVDDDSTLRQLKESCSNDMLKYIQTFVPYSMVVQFKIIGKYGFSPDNNGKQLNNFFGFEFFNNSFISRSHSIYKSN